MTDLSRDELARYVDHTLLKTDATPEQVAALAAEARDLGVYSICVSPSMLPVETPLGDVLVATVCGFPSGKHHSSIKAAEAAQAVRDGADEVDMVIDIGMLKAGNEQAVEAFHAGRLPFLGIVDTIARVVDRHEAPAELTRESLAEAESWPRRTADAFIAAAE